MSSANMKIGPKNADFSPGFWLAVVILCTAVAAVFANTLGGTFVFDDILHISGNDRIRSIESAAGTFFEPLAPGNLYRPFLILSYAFTYSVAGLDPLFFHAGNLGLHALNMILIFIILRRFVPPVYALAISLIAAVHPTPSEAVANISGRSELLVHFFGLSFLAASLNFNEGRYFVSRGLHAVLVCALFLGALLSKESAFSYLILYWLALNFSMDRARLFPGSVAVWAGLGAATAIYSGLRLSAVPWELALGGAGIDFVDNPLAELPWVERVMNASYLLTRYITLILIPYRQSADYSFAQFSPLPSSLSAEQWLSIAIPGLLLVAGILRYRRRDALGLFFLWFFASFAVSGNVFVPVGTAFADRLSYLACPAVLAAALWPAARIKAGYVFVAAYFLACSAITYAHNPVWRDNLSLWSYQMKAAPFSVKSPANYGAALLEQGRLREAQEMLEEAERRLGGSEGVQRLLAELHSELGQPEIARGYYKRALEYRPGDPVTVKSFEKFLKKYGPGPAKN